MPTRRLSGGHDLRDRTLRFASQAAVFAGGLYRWSEPRRTLCTQLVRAATSVGCNAEEAAGGQSRADFLSKISIALKESREALFVLRVIQTARLDESDMLRLLIQEADELVAILTTIVKNTRAGGV
jgi:four helix bundle protein